ncbi:MAG: FtsW/RodA/SpoVE family cell cycle protein, partial [Planctomycetales bacterium]
MDTERKLFLTLVAVLLGFGVLMVHSASITSSPSQAEEIFLSRHLTFAAAGLLAALVASWIPGDWWRRMAPWFFWGSVL